MKKNIENIYPLTELQQALLIHHLGDQADQGQLVVQFTIEGPLDLGLFEASWSEIVERHEALRSSIHHHKLKQPVRVVHRQIKPVIVKGRPQKVDMNLAEVPIDRIYIEEREGDSTEVFWHCHHILLDGWSTAVILKDLFEVYGALERGERPQLSNLPTYKSYLQWQRSQHIDTEKFMGRSDQTDPQVKSIFDLSNRDKRYDEVDLLLPEGFMERCTAVSAKVGTTPSIWFQSLWATILSGLYGSAQVCFGLTSAGRSSEFPQIESLSGLFIKELPVIVEMNELASFEKLIDFIHRKNQIFNELEAIEGSEIMQLLGPGKPIESLLTFENLPFSELRTDSLRVKTFKGGITSTYPLTLVVVPGEGANVTLRYRSDLISKREATDILNSVVKIGHTVQQKMDSNLESLKLEVPLLQPNSVAQEHIYSQPVNPAQLKLIRQWESILAHRPIGIDHNFFALGGTSLQALQLLNLLQEDRGEAISPAVLLQNPTIRLLSEALDQEAGSTWKSMVPLQASGQGRPVFCIHAGGAHVFFYQPFARAFEGSRPIFGIQPQGLDGKSETHQSIEQMAAQYWKEMQDVQSEGPWVVLGYCFSVPVCIEISKLALDQGKDCRVYVVDSGPWFDNEEEPSLVDRMGKLVTIAKNRNWRRLEDIIEDKTKKFRGKYLANIENEQSAAQLRMENSLRAIYRAYIWRPFAGKITLVRSSEFASRPDKEFHIEEWNNLALGGVDVLVVQANHKTIFEGEDVKNLALGIEDHLHSRI